jgi:Xaa-Pro dipeptidase
MIFPREEYEERWRRLEQLLKERRHSTAVIWQRSGGSYDGAGDVYYLTNYASHSSGQEQTYGGAVVAGRGLAALVVRVGEEPELHIAEPATTIDRDDVVCGNVFGHDDNLALGLARRLKSLGIEGPVVYQGDAFMSAEMYRDLITASPQIEWTSDNTLLYKLQSHKSNRELDAYRRGGEISSRALTAMMESLIAGERECDAAAMAAAIIIGSGGGFQRVACHHGPKSESSMWSNPLYGYSTEAPQDGDLVRGWVYGPIHAGYWLDPGRTSVCGKPSRDQKKLVEDCVALVERILAAHKPGVTGRNLGIEGDNAMKQLGYEQDLGGAIWDLYGHSLSTFWLPPYIPAFGKVTPEKATGWHVDEPFHIGQVCTVEVFIRLPQVGTATFEQVGILQEHGLENLTSTPMLFW